MLFSVMCGTVLHWKVRGSVVPLRSQAPRGLRARSSGFSGRSRWWSKLAVISRCLASASATRLVSQVIQRRPHFSATKAVVPLPQVGSSTKSPGSVVIRMQRSITVGLV